MVSEAHLIVKALDASSGSAAVTVINAAAKWYAEFLPPSEFHSEEMTLESWADEARRLTWYGALDGGELVGVMGLERVDDVVLFRHGYVLPRCQRQGIAAILQEHLEQEASGVDRIIVGPYAANYKARAALEKADYQLSPDSEAVLRRYYDIPEDRLQSSVTYEKHRADGR